VKFARRRATETPETLDAAPEPPARPTPPRGSPVSAYAGIVDGQTLWLAVEAVAGSLALRGTGSTDVIALRSDLAEDQPAYRSIRVDLAELPGDEPASYDVVLVPPGGGNPRPVWTRPLAAGGPLRTPPTRDGATQHALERTEDGFLRVRRESVAPAGELRAMGLRDGGIELTVAPVDAEPTLLLLDQESPDVVVSCPLDVTDAGWHTSVTLDRLPADDARVLRVGVGTAERWVPVRRRHNDLTNPNRSVLLPQLYDEATDRPRLRARWTGEGLLQLRLLRPEAPGAEDDA
jgi:hypothetical protein